MGRAFLRRGWWLLVLAIAVTDATARAPADLPSRLGAALRTPALRGAEVAALVVRAADGQVLFEQAADHPVVPASNAKILTALAALATFGPAHRFTTEVYADARPDGKGTVRTLAVRGGGDPAMTSEDWWRLAADLRRTGLRRVAGELVLDDSRFDAERWNPAWGGVSARAYHAPVGALSANYGAFTVEVHAGNRPGDHARVLLDPPVPYFIVSNSVRVVPRRARSELRVSRRADGDAMEHVVVGGTVAAGSGSHVFYRSVADPTRYAGAVLRMHLEANGITVAGRTRTGAVPERSVRLLAFSGRSLAEIVRRFLKHSNNAVAEALVKAMGVKAGGAPGSWERGLQAVRERLAALDLDTTGLVLADGSGLAYSNRVTPRTLVDALRIARGSFQFAPEFIAGLPIGATDGTLKKRARQAAGLVRAKTGLLNGVVALSGYALAQDGVEVVFSILVNGYRKGDADAMAAVDGFVAAVVTSPAGAEVGPAAAAPETPDGGAR